MEPAPRKRFEECPRCRSPEVRVPWAPSAARLRRRILWGIALLWLTGLGWAAYGAARGGTLWVVALAAYAAVTVLAGLAFYFGSGAYRCAACGKRWRAK